MMELGIIGRKLGHSMSPAYFAEKFISEGVEGSYDIFELEDISMLPLLLREHPDLTGFNVTVPYKEAVIPYLSELSPEAEAINAVNTVKVARNGKDLKLIGHNTDYIGFADSLSPLVNMLSPMLGVSETGALIFGTGGASKAVAFALCSLGIPFAAVSRHPGQDNEFTEDGHDVIGYDRLTPDVMRRHRILVNCTPLGMWPDTAGCPDIPWNCLAPDAICYDLVYNPAVTTFMKRGAERGAAVKNGLDMLHKQADAAWEIWRR